MSLTMLALMLQLVLSPQAGALLLSTGFGGTLQQLYQEEHDTINYSGL